MSSHILLSQCHIASVGATEMALINYYLHVFNDIKFKYTQSLSSGKFEGLTRKEKKHCVDKHNLLPYRVFKGVETQVKGLVASQQTCRKNTLTNIQYNVNVIESDLKDLRAKLKNSKARQSTQAKIDNKAFKEKVKKLCFSITKKSEKLQRLQAKQLRLQNEVSNNKISLCYGSKTLLKKRNRIHSKDTQKI